MYSITKESKSFYIFRKKNKKTKLNYCKLTLINQPPQSMTPTQQQQQNFIDFSLISRHKQSSENFPLRPTLGFDES